MSKMNAVLSGFASSITGGVVPHSSGGDDEVCHCVERVEPGTFPPFVPCCESCPSCGLWIKKEYFTIHVKRCSRELEGQAKQFDDVSHCDDGGPTRDGEFSMMH